MRLTLLAVLIPAITSLATGAKFSESRWCLLDEVREGYAVQKENVIRHDLLFRWSSLDSNKEDLRFCGVLPMVATNKMSTIDSFIEFESRAVPLSHVRAQEIGSDVPWACAINYNINKIRKDEHNGLIRFLDDVERSGFLIVPVKASNKSSDVNGNVMYEDPLGVGDALSRGGMIVATGVVALRAPGNWKSKSEWDHAGGTRLRLAEYAIVSVPDEGEGRRLEAFYRLCSLSSDSILSFEHPQTSAFTDDEIMKEKRLRFEAAKCGGLDLAVELADKGYRVFLSVEGFVHEFLLSVKP